MKFKHSAKRNELSKISYRLYRAHRTLLARQYDNYSEARPIKVALMLVQGMILRDKCTGIQIKNILYLIEEARRFIEGKYSPCKFHLSRAYQIVQEIKIEYPETREFLEEFSDEV